MSCSRLYFRAGWLAVAACLVLPAAEAVGQAAGEESWLARVDEAVIDRAMVQRLVARRFSDARDWDRAARRRAEAAALGSLVRRQIALAELRAAGGAALQARIERQWTRILERRRQVDPEASLTRGERAEIAWRLAWNDYLGIQLSETNLESYYEAFQWRYDGSRVRLRQIFLPRGAVDSDDAEAVDSEDASAAERLAELGRSVARGEIDFADAARQHSQSPTAAEGGLLGWVRGDGDLPRAVSEVAFTGAVNEPLGPVRSSRGWHLLWVERREPGDREFADFADRQRLRRDAVDFLFERLVRRGLGRVEVRWHPDLELPPNLTPDRLLESP